MQQVLLNLALIALNKFCHEHGIDISNTYCSKDGRGFAYSLKDGTTGEPRRASVTFHKSGVPTFRFIEVAK